MLRELPVCSFYNSKATQSNCLREYIEQYDVVFVMQMSMCMQSQGHGSLQVRLACSVRGGTASSIGLLD